MAANGLAPPRSQGEVKRVSVAVVDDHPVSRTTLNRLLSDIDVSIGVVEFSKPKDALTWLSSATPGLIITDYRMPQMDGVEFVRRVRKIESTRWTPIMLITVLDDCDVKKQALRAGATDFLNKPIDHDECRARCTNLLDLSNCHALLREQLAMSHAYIDRLHNTVAGATPRHREPHNVDPDDPYVVIEYRDLFEATSTLGAIDQMLQSWRKSRRRLEAAINRPLQGSESDD